MDIFVNAAGCTHACRHCSVSGMPPYGAFYSLDALRRIAAEWGPIVPYFEATTHPEFPEILGPDIVGEGWNVLSTNGVGLAQRDGWRDCFDRLRELGFYLVSLTLHGLEENHDRFVAHPGAFQAILSTSRRAVEAGFQLFWQLYPDRRNLTDVPRLVEMARREFGLTLWLEVPRHHVSRRAWLYEAIRPSARDLSEVLEPLDPAAWQGRLKDRELDDLTEASWMRVWQEHPESEAFGPRSWPEPPHQQSGLFIDEERHVFLDHWCGDRIPLGSLADGKEKVLAGIADMPAPRYHDLSPDQARLRPEDADLLHPNGFSVRSKAVSCARFGEH